MNPDSRTLLRVVVPEADAKATAAQVEALMGRKPELRFQFIQEHAGEVEEFDV